ncbi:TPA: hypothetical protein ACF3QL_003918 [Escherichia coli]|uniref:hypothetical protein n=1 Tax=Escherichia coli TaxID=562 RepID=UPI000932C114|nr:hypothetical protein [Escherichia coli]EFO5053045.1 hypothetical protein [Escherichia coli]EFO5587380.1 hypothetical protein [Escherichia coli]EIX4153130.1 hypothetical protein [Escherichia coli]EMA2650091.1 hypothetical protein [Escherichia coli]EMC8388013.1 hypothetical protein [Escherichia coli]
MTTITKERLLTIKQWRETYGPGSNVVLPAEEAEELARIALASLEAEPIGFRCRRNDNLGDWSYVYHREPDDFERKHLVIEGIYAAPPAPVVPEEKPIPNPLSMYAVDAVAAIAEVRGWNACRAAMLHSAEPASNHEELPLDYLQGQKDGLEWAAQLAEANHPQTGDWLYDDPLELAKAIRKGPDMPEFDGPTPVTPDGWIMVPKKLTAENGAKVVLSGEFSESTFISCPECFGDDDCDTCDGSGRIEIKVPVTWATIKSIWDKSIEYFAAKPSQEVK